VKIGRRSFGDAEGTAISRPRRLRLRLASEVNEALVRQVHREPSSWRTPATPSWSAGPARAKPISPRPSASRPSSITASVSGSSPLSISSMPSNRRSSRESPARSRRSSPIPISSSSTSLATCRSAPPAGSCSSTSSAGSTNARPSSSPPIPPSANGRAFSENRAFHDALLLDRLVRRRRCCK
jgi:hypothetical protein